MHVLQDITTCPTLNLHQIPNLATLLAVETTLGLQVHCPHAGGWVHHLNIILQVETHQKIFIRKEHVSVLGLEMYENVSIHSLKRKASGPPSLARSSKVPRTQSIGLNFDLLSSSSSSSSPLSFPQTTLYTPSSLFPDIDLSHDNEIGWSLEQGSSYNSSLPLSAGMTLFSSTLSTTDSMSTKSQQCFAFSPSPGGDNEDWMWHYHHVLTPDYKTKTDIVWPAGMYVRDMAKGFDLMEVRSPLKKELQFATVFPGVKYHRSTWYAQRDFWKVLSESDRQKARSLPRDNTGDYIEWRRSVRQ